jgi:hypothetical protein
VNTVMNILILLEFTIFLENLRNYFLLKKKSVYGIMGGSLVSLLCTQCAYSVCHNVRTVYVTMCVQCMSQCAYSVCHNVRTVCHNVRTVYVHNVRTVYVTMCVQCMYTMCVQCMSQCSYSVRHNVRRVCHTLRRKITDVRRYRRDD